MRIPDVSKESIRARAIDILQRNKKNCSIKTIQTVCEALGVSCKPPRGGGSHYKVSKPGKREILTIPFKRPIKPIYIKKLIAFLSEDTDG